MMFPVINENIAQKPLFLVAIKRMDFTILIIKLKSTFHRVLLARKKHKINYFFQCIKLK